MIKDLKQTVDKYLAVGWNVLPLYENKKGCLLKWEKYKTQKITSQDWDEWIKNNPDVTGIAVITGKISDLTVVDDDSYKTGIALEINSPLESKTASSGRHIFFKYSNVGNSNNSGEHFFEVQEEGKLIVLPPSQVINKSGEMSEYTWLKRSIKNIADLPTIDQSFLPQKEQNTKRIIDLIDAPIGTQHHNLRDIINKMLWKFEPDEWERLVDPFIYEEAQKFNPPHPESRVTKLLQDCKKFNLEKRNIRQHPKKTSDIGTERIEEKKLEAISPKTGFSKLDELIKGFVPGHLYTLTGHTNVGKTTLAANFAINISKQGKRVLYFALEPGSTIVEYLATIRNKKQFDSLSNEEIKEFDPNIDIYLQEDVKTLNDLVSVVKKLDRYDLIIIDHIGYYTSDAKKTLNDSQADVLKELAKLSKSKRCAVMVIAHIRKSAKDIPTIDDISGSGAFKQDSTEVLVAIREKREIDGNNFEYLSKGYIIVMKTKSGMNGSVPIEFSHKSAYIGAL